MSAGRVIRNAVVGRGREQKSEQRQVRARGRRRRCGGRRRGRPIGAVQAGVDRAPASAPAERRGRGTAARGRHPPVAQDVGATAIDGRGPGRGAATAAGQRGDQTTAARTAVAGAAAAAAGPAAVQGAATAVGATAEGADRADHPQLQQAQRRRIVHVRLRGGRRQLQGGDARH